MIIDESILEGCIAGNREAQFELYKKFASTMLALCFRYARNRDEAEDPAGRISESVSENLDIPQGRFFGRVDKKDHDQQCVERDKEKQEDTVP